VKKTKEYHAAAGESGHSSRHMPDLNAHRVRRVNYRTYAVGSNPGMCRDKRPDSPPAGRKNPCLFAKKLHTVQLFCEQANKRIMLPPVKTTFTGVAVSFERALRTSCHWQDVRGRWPDKRFCLRQGGRNQSFAQKICT